MRIIVRVRQVPDSWEHRDAPGGTEIIALTMGPPEAASARKKSLSMGADSGFHVVDDAPAGADALRTSAVLATADAPTDSDLIIAANQWTDGRPAGAYRAWDLEIADRGIVGDGFTNLLQPPMHCSCAGSRRACSAPRRYTSPSCYDPIAAFMGKVTRG